MQLERPLNGTRVKSLVGPHHTLQVVRPAGGAAAGIAAAGTGGSSTGGGGAAALAAADGSISTTLPPDAIVELEITDGSSVADKVAQLSELEGEWSGVES